MKKDWSFLERMSQNMDFPIEVIPGRSIVELSGFTRCLIENHRGVTQYSNVKIGVKTDYGQIIICGNRLEFLQISKEQLIVVGEIENIILEKGGKG